MFRHEYSGVVYYGYTGSLEDSAYVSKDSNVSSFDDGIDNVKVLGVRSELESGKRAEDRFPRFPGTT